MRWVKEFLLQTRSAEVEVSGIHLRVEMKAVKYRQTNRVQRSPTRRLIGGFGEFASEGLPPVIGQRKGVHKGLHLGNRSRGPKGPLSPNWLLRMGIRVLGRAPPYYASGWLSSWISVIVS